MNARMRHEPDAGMGIFDHWFEFDPPPPRDAGMGIFDHWFEFDPKPGPDAGMGIFSHYLDD